MSIGDQEPASGEQNLREKGESGNSLIRDNIDTLRLDIEKLNEICEKVRRISASQRAQRTPIRPIHVEAPPDERRHQLREHEQNAGNGANNTGNNTNLTNYKLLEQTSNVGGYLLLLLARTLIETNKDNSLINITTTTSDAQLIEANTESPEESRRETPRERTLDDSWVLLDETDSARSLTTTTTTTTIDQVSDLADGDHEQTSAADWAHIAATLSTRSTSSLLLALSSSECSDNDEEFYRSARKQLHDTVSAISTIMALEPADIELIRASWAPASQDPDEAGIMLFKELFTKFPEYLKFFSKFSDLDLEHMHENKRLIKHATKVIDTVTFVVDSIGDEAKGQQLNDALVNLVRGHLNRKIGSNEFRNLGIVIIDFICDLNNRRDSQKKRSLDTNLLVASWTKLYSIILDLVRREEA